MAVTGKKLTDQTADRIFQMIISEPGYGPGAKLPNEAELSQMFQVSRTTLREAVRSLVTQGYLEVRRGSGTFVADRTSIRQDIGLAQLSSVQMRLQELFEIRLMLEPSTALLACQRGTEEEIGYILKCGEQVAWQIHHGGDWDSADLLFHKSFVQASHNQFMEQLIPIINKAVSETWNMIGAYPQLPEMVLRDNELIMGFLRARDCQGTKIAMAAHLRHVISALNFGDTDFMNLL